MGGNCNQPSPAGTYCLTDSEITTEIESVRTAHGWPSGLGPIYFVYLPPGTSVCATDSTGQQCSYTVFCAYHSAYSPDGQHLVLYAVEAYAAVEGCDAGHHPNGNDADAVLDSTSHEHNETLTDPLGDAWLDIKGNEIGDKCEHQYGPALGGNFGAEFDQSIGSGNYWIQQEFSNANSAPGDATSGCEMSLGHAPPQLALTLPSGRLVAGRSAAFSSRVTDSSPIATYTWTFGDGTAAVHGALVSHSFAAWGQRTVTLTAVDGDGLEAVASRVVTVSPPTPVPSFTSSPRAPSVGSSVRFNASASIDPVGSARRWSWNFGDGTRARGGPTVRHTYRHAGRNVVTLTITDTGGARASVSHTIKVGPHQ